MRKQDERQAGSALIPVTSSLPAQLVNVPDDRWKELDEEFRNETIRKIKAEKSENNFMRAGILLCAGGTAALGGALPLVPILFVTGIIGAGVGVGGAWQKIINNTGAECAKRGSDTAREAFRQAQRAAYNSQKEQIVAAAEQHLGKGGLLSMEDAAWLGNLDQESIARATDQLAITVLQIRQMLAHERCASFNSDGSKAAAKPVTFAEKKLMTDFNPHRAHLRRDLLDQDSTLAEDSLPALIEPELAQELKAKSGYLRGLADFVNPFSGIRLKREMNALALPQFKPVEIPGMQPVADFFEALEAYESRNAPLDLPAVRGWSGGKRKALPGPKAAL